MRLDVRLIARLLSLLEDLERDQSGSKEFSFLSFSLFERSPLRGISFERFGDASRVYTRNYMPAPLEETRENGFFQGYFLPALEDDAGPIIDPSKGHPPDGSSTSRTRMRFTFTNRSVRSLRRFSHPITAVERIDSISPRPSERGKRKERERERKRNARSYCFVLLFRGELVSPSGEEFMVDGRFDLFLDRVKRNRVC